MSRRRTAAKGAEHVWGDPHLITADESMQYMVMHHRSRACRRCHILERPDGLNNPCPGATPKGTADDHLRRFP